ncbi:MAG: Hpt domain-containing protein [Lachnospiraceae bacterium]|nr:Hpt domain-containing protein [Lachnospiraceae bacterium]
MTLNDLREWGANVDEGMARCINNEAFYLKMVGKCLEDHEFEALGDALDEGNIDKAFESAHALKGVVSNLSLTPLQNKVSEITELLRAKTEMDYSGLYQEIIGLKDELVLL